MNQEKSLLDSVPQKLVLFAVNAHLIDAVESSTIKLSAKEKEIIA